MWISYFKPQQYWQNEEMLLVTIKGIFQVCDWAIPKTNVCELLLFIKVSKENLKSRILEKKQKFKRNSKSELQLRSCKKNQ